MQIGYSPFQALITRGGYVFQVQASCKYVLITTETWSDCASPTVDFSFSSPSMQWLQIFFKASMNTVDLKTSAASTFKHPTHLGQLY